MFLKSPDEMAHLFRDHPDAVKSTLQIAERCAGLKLKLGKPMLPTFPVPDGDDAGGLLPQGGARRARSPLRRDGRAERAKIDEAAYRRASRPSSTSS